MKRKWEEPTVIVQKFTPNGYISSCGVLEDVISNPHKIYMGAFYHDKELLHPDSTANGHEEAEDFGEKECVREADKSPWGYHYHFTEVTNRSRDRKKATDGAVYAVDALRTEAFYYWKFFRT